VSRGESAVEIVVHVRGMVTEGAVVLRAIEAQTGVVLEPMHPGARDPELSRFAVTRVAPSSVESTVDRLLRCAEVDAAYAKPGDALP
jgi:hypothetical protein